ncbi:MAG: hypothetical protein ACM3ML_22520 [Micromonosporaceae bacterium]
MICSAPVAQAVPAAEEEEEEEEAAAAGLRLLAEAAGALGLAAEPEPDAAGGLLLPDEAQPARTAAPISAPTARADPENPVWESLVWENPWILRGMA